MVDLEVRNEGSLFLFMPESVAGERFLKAHAPDDAQWWAGGLVIEHRYAQNWATRAQEAGLIVE